MEPLAQDTIRLMPEPMPCGFDHGLRFALEQQPNFGTLPCRWWEPSTASQTDKRASRRHRKAAVADELHPFIVECHQLPALEARYFCTEFRFISPRFSSSIRARFTRSKE